MTIVLIAVYVPIGFQGGLTGALFTEFAFTLVGGRHYLGCRGSDILADAVLDLPDAAFGLSFIMGTKLTGFIDRSFERVRVGYEHVLRDSLNYKP